MPPLVTVYITTHNRGRRLITAVNSVLNQTYKNIEIIISDDGSQDNTPEIVESLTSEFSNIRYVRNEIPMGANHARNRALELARGVFITGLDDDDEFKEDRIQLFVSNWDDKYAFICDNFIDSFKDREDAHYMEKDILFSCENLLFENLASNQVFTLSERLREVGGFNLKLKRLQDWDCWLRLSHRYGTAKRFNWCTYMMYHDQIDRISNNQKSREAYKVFVKENLHIYKLLRGGLGVKLADNSKAITLSDLIRAKSKIEFKILLKEIILSRLK
ncbi:glycosyltransferase family 2 protein [Pseudoalteromonas sp. NZS11_1]|uniref:glycosyltransferase family 2 protein n=1 Tax=Pseudoalteromonas sp. NZS11_1 TaxID=2792070 RepID=UPI0018CCFCAB|nr:glycosyltransferase family 2 protein [Pseudoalteromonas sp. NZS11_1]MBH0044855.1 glycosyltransferase family 2 protein [Pseudoalteromonas sp. NZS11_1]